jgi:hypothetical protein
VTDQEAGVQFRTSYVRTVKSPMFSTPFENT